MNKQFVAAKTMEVCVMKCPNCGSEIPNGTKFCEYCGSSVTLEMQKEQEELNKAQCPNCGSSNIKYSREKQGEVVGKKGTAVVRNTVAVCQDCGYTWTTAGEDIPKKRKTWLWVLGWIFIFPVPLTILMLRNKKLKPILKYIIIAVAWIVYLCWIIFGGSSDTEVEESASTEVIATDTTEVSTADTGTETFVITPGELGEYGFEKTLNKDNEAEETKIVYHIPAGTYTVKNIGDYAGQINVYSDETHFTEDGWEEPVEAKDCMVIEPNETAEFSIEEGYYLEINVVGSMEFALKQ